MGAMRTMEILDNVVAMIAEGEEYNRTHKRYGMRMRWRIADVCNQLNIFDWWNEYLSVSQLKQMERFLRVALELGYTGYACFKVGAAGCSHGMWANKAESTDGYSPDGECIYHSFRSGENYYDAELKDGTWVNRDMNLKELKEVLARDAVA